MGEFLVQKAARLVALGTRPRKRSGAAMRDRQSFFFIVMARFVRATQFPLRHNWMARIALFRATGP